MSRAPRGTFTFSRSKIVWTMRSASWTPRRWIPTTIRSAVPSFSSHDLFGHAAERPVNRARVEQGRIVSCHPFDVIGLT